MQTNAVVSVAAAHVESPAWAELFTYLGARAEIHVLRAVLADKLLPSSLGKGAAVVLVDISLTDKYGRDAIEGLIASSRPARTIVVSREMRSDLAVLAARMGAIGLVSLAERPDRIVKAIRCVHSGEAWFDRRAVARVLASLGPLRVARLPAPPASAAILTNRERDVVVLLALGLKNREIGERLFISEVTVRHHLTSVFQKVGVTSRHSLVLYSYRTGLVSAQSRPEKTLPPTTPRAVEAAVPLRVRPRAS